MVSRHLSGWCGQGRWKQVQLLNPRGAPRTLQVGRQRLLTPYPGRLGKGVLLPGVCLSSPGCGAAWDFCQLSYVDAGAFSFPIAWPSCQVGLRSLGLSSSALQVRPCMTWSQPPLLASLAAIPLNRWAYPFQVEVTLLCPFSCVLLIVSQATPTCSSRT